MSDRRIFVVLGTFILASLAAIFAVLRGSGYLNPAPPPAPTEVIALYLDERVPGVTDPMGLRVAEVGIDARGRASLLRCNEPSVADEVSAALLEVNSLPTIPAKSESVAETADGAVRSLSVEQVGPDDPKYPWALAGFLRQKTGLRYQVLPPAAP